MVLNGVHSNVQMPKCQKIVQNERQVCPVTGSTAVHIMAKAAVLSNFLLAANV